MGWCPCNMTLGKHASESQADFLCIVFYETIGEWNFIVWIYLINTVPLAYNSELFQSLLL